MMRRHIDAKRAAALCRRHGAIAALAGLALGALVALAGLALADHRALAARATRDITDTAAETARSILDRQRRLADQLADAATADPTDAVLPSLLDQAPSLAPGIAGAAYFDPNGSLLVRGSGRLDETTLAALGADAVRAIRAGPDATLRFTRAMPGIGPEQPVVGLVRPYYTVDGTLDGIALLIIDRSAFAALDRLPVRPPGGRFELLRADDTPLFGQTDAIPSAGSRRAELSGFPLALRYRPVLRDAARGLRNTAPYLAAASLALFAALALVGLLLRRQHLAAREIARLAGLERRLRQEAAAAAATADRSTELNRTKSRFFAQVTHELRTPLNAILGFSETIRQEMFGPVTNPRYLEYAGLIHDAGSHLLSLINDLLDNARIEAGKMEVAPIRLSAPALARSALDLVAPLAEGRDIHIATSGLAACPDLNVDPRAMKQVLVNLLSNAIKYTPPGGRIDVRFTGRSDGGVAIEIADTGIGMSAADAAHAFEPFGRATSDKARRQQGTGLGLSLARALVRLHGGDLTLASRLDAGTTATVTLPTSAAFAAPRLALPAKTPDAAAA